MCRLINYISYYLFLVIIYCSCSIIIRYCCLLLCFYFYLLIFIFIFIYVFYCLLGSRPILFGLKSSPRMKPPRPNLGLNAKPNNSQAQHRSPTRAGTNGTGQVLLFSRPRQGLHAYACMAWQEQAHQHQLLLLPHAPSQPLHTPSSCWRASSPCSC